MMNVPFENEAILKLDRLVFDRIDFKRIGFQTESETEFRFSFAHKEQGDNRFIVHLDITGKKEGEYDVAVSASGYFTLESTNPVALPILQNAAAIIFPYIRSQISLLTAQPEMEPLVIPPLNIAKLIEDAMNDAQK